VVLVLVEVVEVVQEVIELLDTDPLLYKVQHYH
jgi:hypothetical protein